MYNSLCTMWSGPRSFLCLMTLLPFLHCLTTFWQQPWFVVSVCPELPWQFSPFILSDLKSTTIHRTPLDFCTDRSFFCIAFTSRPLFLFKDENEIQGQAVALQLSCCQPSQH